MKNIRIMQLRLENFKCHRLLALDLQGNSATIYGDNATGKTSVYDALMWLLFSKDSAGNGEKNFEIKPLDSDGNVIDHNALTSVEVLFSVNGEELRLRRTYKEVWSTKRGASEATFDGHTSEYYVDGVPVKRNAFQNRVDELVDEDTFRLLTNTSHFASGISWTDRRAELFKLAGVMDDAQILLTDAAFAPLVESMGKLSLEDYKKKLLAEKKQFMGAKTDIPARISECNKTIEDISGLDFAGAKAELETLNGKKEELSEQILLLDHSSAAEDKSLQIQKAQLELSTLEAENKAYRDRQLMGSVDVHSLNIRLTSLQTQLAGRQNSYASLNAALIGYDNQVTECRSRWKQVNDEVFSGGVCLSCGQALPADRLTAATEAFESGKRLRLAEIEKTANACKESRAQAEQRMAELQAEIRQMEEEISQLQQSITAAEATKVEPRDMADYAQRKAEISSRIDKLNEDLHEIIHATADRKARLRQEMSELSDQISGLMTTISKESLLAYSKDRVQQLREEAKTAAQCMESIEKMLFLMDQYSRYKTKFVEDSINRMFRIARFRLFREQANGGVEERCDVVYDGIPYGSVNNGMKINLGIDIINTLSKAYGVRVPLFVDNAESVTKLKNCDSQIIRLVVSETDKELRVNYES